MSNYFKDLGVIYENINSNNIVEDIKKSLFEYHGEDSWEDFVDNQEMGNCQFIVSYIIDEFPIAKKVFGEIEVDEPYYDEYGDEQNLMTHHWVTINGFPYDFSKGSLRNYIIWDDVYNPMVDEPERYNSLFNWIIEDSP